MPKDSIEIDVARDFSTYPAGRDERGGPDNGTRFREEFLLPALRRTMNEGGEVVVNLNGVTAYTANFLEEAFGGLVWREGLDASEVRRHLRVEGRERYTDAIERSLDGVRT